MNLSEKLTADLQRAQKRRDSRRVSILRILKSEIHKHEIQTGAQAQDRDVEQIARRLVKQTKESIKQYQKAGRKQAQASEEAELAILKEYLPEQADATETKDLVKRAISSLGASSLQDIGKVMAEVMKTSKGGVDGALASQIAKRLLKKNEAK